MSSDLKNRRFPRVLADKVSRALYGVRNLDSKHSMGLLEKHRKNRAKFIAENGITLLKNEEFKTPTDLEYIPIEYAQAIEQLDKAFQELHAYQNDGAIDYLAQEIFSVVQSLNAKRPRERGTEYADIIKHFKRINYPERDDKKALIKSAQGKFKTSRTTIYEALKQGGLTKK